LALDAVPPRTLPSVAVYKTFTYIHIEKLVYPAHFDPEHRRNIYHPNGGSITHTHTV
jgi:hypothetical protein